MFEPKILGFCCNWCAYAGADLAGINRNQYATNIRIIRVVSSGTIDPLFIMKSFQDVIQVVFIGGCSYRRLSLSGGIIEQREVAVVQKKLAIWDRPTQNKIGMGFLQLKE